MKTFDKIVITKRLLRIAGLIVAALFTSSCGDSVDCPPRSIDFQRTFNTTTNPYHFVSHYTSYQGITWRNITTGQSGTGTSSGPYAPTFCMFPEFGGCQDLWKHEADIWLTAGENHVEVTIGGSCTGTIYDYMITYIPSFPDPPRGLVAESADGQIILTWNSVSNAEFYNIYWANEPNVTKDTGTKIENVSSPYVHSGLTDGMTYYYVLTSQYSDIDGAVIEGGASEEISAVAGAPSQSTGVNVEAVGDTITITWNADPMATSYNVYWSNESGVTTNTGTKIEGANSPYFHYGLTGIPYYYIVTGVNVYGEGTASPEVIATPQAPPPAPYPLTIEELLDEGSLKLQWEAVPGVGGYELWRNYCTSYFSSISSCEDAYMYCNVRDYWAGSTTLYSGSNTEYVDTEVGFTGYISVLKYSIQAVNDYGISSSTNAYICTELRPW